MTMIEKAIEALQKAEQNIALIPTSKEYRLQILAKVVIEAIREPTKDMIDAGHLYASICSEDASDAYKAMINYILEEK
jgi:hypothetical protein